MALMAALQPTRRGLGRLPRIVGEDQTFPGHEGGMPAGANVTATDQEEMIEVFPGIFLPKSVAERMGGGNVQEQEELGSLTSAQQIRRPTLTQEDEELQALPAERPAPPAYPLTREDLETLRQPPTTGFPRQPSRVGRGLRAAGAALLNALPAAIEGAATPNIAGGGGTDVMRAMQAAGRFQAGRDIMSHERGMKERQERRAGMTAEAQAEADRATAEAQREHARLYREQAEAAKRGKPKDEYMSVGTGGLFNVSKGEWVRQPEGKLEPIEDGLLRDLANPQTPAARRTQIQSAFEARYGHRAPERPNPTEASLALLAASGDKIAQRALGMLQAQRGGPDERQKKARVSSAWQRYYDDLNQAEQEFSTAKTKLDQPGVRPGTKHPTTMMMSQLTWDDYNNQLYDLETLLQTKKNNASRATEAVLDEFDVAHTPSRYPHPSTQRRSGGVPVGAGATTTEVQIGTIAEDPKGKRHRWDGTKWVPL